jgi:hypothetical protein
MFIVAGLTMLIPVLGLGISHSESIPFKVTPAAAGEQLVRASLPIPRKFIQENQTLVAEDGTRKIQTTVRSLSWYPIESNGPAMPRRAIVTFPYVFKDLTPVKFKLGPARVKQPVQKLKLRVYLESEVLHVSYSDGPNIRLRMLAPTRASTKTARHEIIESNAFYRWERFVFPDPHWPRIIEVRSDVLGSVVAIAHLQRNLPDNGRAPDFGWEAELSEQGQAFINIDAHSKSTNSQTPEANRKEIVGTNTVIHAYTNGTACTLLFRDQTYCIYHPAAPSKKRGHSKAERKADSVRYRYWRCTADEKVPMQPASWQRAEIVIAPAQVARLKPSLQSPHEIALNAQHWDQLYNVGPLPDINHQPQLKTALNYHHDAIVHSMALGDDWGNVVSYRDGVTEGGVFGMNRLNHCPAIFQEAWRSGDRRLIETALLWCDNFYDQSIWWGEKQTGGTRYNNMIAQGRTPPDNDQTYMWRSNDSVNFCTKGYDSFWLAYEETGDPRMLEALEAQVKYAAEHVHADRGECRNVGDVREFVRLYSSTGEKRYLDEALRLFRELRTKLSENGLFDQGGKPLSPSPPFIDDDETGTKVGYAKPYIIGYALAGLPELAMLAPTEPRLREVVKAVADFLAESQDPLGGWRYPHPRSSYLILSQAIEHAWQLVQAERLLGPQEKHLDAIERVLRQRIIGWQQTGKILSGLGGWEQAAGKQRAEINQLYKRPEDRTFTRDYREGGIGLGSSPPEGLVYFPEVLSYYLQHRPASRLLTPPEQDEPLAPVLSRIK